MSSAAFNSRKYLALDKTDGSPIMVMMMMMMMMMVMMMEFLE